MSLWLRSGVAVLFIPQTAQDAQILIAIILRARPIISHYTDQKKNCNRRERHRTSVARRSTRVRIGAVFDVLSIVKRYRKKPILGQSSEIPFDRRLGLEAPKDPPFTLSILVELYLNILASVGLMGLSPGTPGVDISTLANFLVLDFLVSVR